MDQRRQQQAAIRSAAAWGEEEEQAEEEEIRVRCKRPRRLSDGDDDAGAEQGGAVPAPSRGPSAPVAAQCGEAAAPVRAARSSGGGSSSDEGDAAGRGGGCQSGGSTVDMEAMRLRLLGIMGLKGDVPMEKQLLEDMPYHGAKDAPASAAGEGSRPGSRSPSPGASPSLAPPPGPAAAVAGSPAVAPDPLQPASSSPLSGPATGQSPAAAAGVGRGQAACSAETPGPTKGAASGAGEAAPLATDAAAAVEHCPSRPKLRRLRPGSGGPAGQEPAKGPVRGKQAVMAAAAALQPTGAAGALQQAGWAPVSAGCRVRRGTQLAYAATPSVSLMRVTDLLGLLAEVGCAGAQLLDAETETQAEEAQAVAGGGATGAGGSGLAGPPGPEAPSHAAAMEPASKLRRTEGAAVPGEGSRAMGQLEAAAARMVADGGDRASVLEQPLVPTTALAVALAVHSSGRVAGAEQLRRLRRMATAVLPAWEVRRVLACRGLGSAVQASAVLRLPAGAGRDEVRVAFRRMSLLVHPDKNRSSGAAEAFALVNASATKLLSGGGRGCRK